VALANPSIFSLKATGGTPAPKLGALLCRISTIIIFGMSVVADDPTLETFFASLAPVRARIEKIIFLDRASGVTKNRTRKSVDQ